MTIHVEQYRQGDKTTLAIHGWGGDHREFAPLASRLPQGMRLLSVDLPGYGQSPLPTHWDLSHIVRGLASVVDDAGLADLTLMGFCSGAFLALLLARERKEQVARLVMIDPFAYLPWYFKLFTLGEFGRRAYHASFVSAAGRTIVNMVLQRRQPTDSSFTEAFTRVDHEATQRYLNMFSRFGGLESFRELGVAVDLVYGANTFTAVRRSVRYFQALWPHARIHELKGVGHLPLVKGARQLAKILCSIAG